MTEFSQIGLNLPLFLNADLSDLCTLEWSNMCFSLIFLKKPNRSDWISKESTEPVGTKLSPFDKAELMCSQYLVGKVDYRVFAHRRVLGLFLVSRFFLPPSRLSLVLPRSCFGCGFPVGFEKNLSQWGRSLSAVMVLLCWVIWRLLEEGLVSSSHRKL